jgi:hypothetical protein
MIVKSAVTPPKRAAARVANARREETILLGVKGQWGVENKNEEKRKTGTRADRSIRLGIPCDRKNTTFVNSSLAFNYRNSTTPEKYVRN